MRGNRRFGIILLLGVFAAPSLGQTAPGQPADKTVLVFGQMIHYFDTGSGPVMVLLHGLGSRKEDWLPVIEPLAQKYRLLIPDQIGFGRSDKPLLDYSIQTYVDFLNEYLRQLKVERASLVGESLGGWIAGLYAVELSGGAHLIPVEKLVLVDAAGLKQDKPIPDLNPSSLASMRTMMEAVFYDTSWLSEEELRKIFTDKLSVHDGYTVRSVLGNPTLAGRRDLCRRFFLGCAMGELLPHDKAEQAAVGQAQFDLHKPAGLCVPALAAAQNSVSIVCTEGIATNDSAPDDPCHHRSDCNNYLGD